MISILTSGIGFGTYIPSLVLARQLSRCGIEARCEVIENLFNDDRKHKLSESQKAYHDSFALAKVAMRSYLTHRESNYDLQKVNCLLEQWTSNKQEQFIVFSGSWNSILKAYEKTRRIHVWTIHTDNTISPSWHNFDVNRENDLWIVGKDLSLPDVHLYHNEITPFETRKKRIIMHGGGWDLSSPAPMLSTSDLLDKGYDLYQISSLDVDAADRKAGIHYYSTKGWQPWQNNTLSFPPLYHTEDGKQLNINDEHYVYMLECKSRAIISKAGGSTLLESFAGAIPIVFSESLSKHETMNKKKWIELGFGIDLESWKRHGYSETELYQCYEKLALAREKVKNSLYQMARLWTV